jgi:hypothetical protein
LAKFPEPPLPDDLAARVAPEVRKVSSGSVLWRLYFRAGPHATTWSQFRSYGPVSSGRFDHHSPPPHRQERATLYAAAEGPTCLAEVFQDARVIDRRRNEPWLVAFLTDGGLDLLDLTGVWPTRAGASMAINSGPRPRAQRWARVIYAAYPTIHGIYYPSSMDGNRPAVALFERALFAMPKHPRLHRALAEAPLLIPIANAAARFGYRVV